MSCATGPGVAKWRSLVGSPESIFSTDDFSPAAKFVYGAIEKEKSARREALIALREEQTRQAALSEQESRQRAAEVALKKWNDDVGGAASVYYDCVARMAAEMAVASGEPAETIAKGAKASCSDKRSSLINVFAVGVSAGELTDLGETKLIEAADEEASNRAIEAAITARARKQATPAQQEAEQRETAARAGPLSPADEYVECVERATSESASRHVGDMEVARSPVPDKVLGEFASDDIVHACGPQIDALKGDDIAEGYSRGYDAKVAVIDQALVEHPPQRQPPPPGSDDYEHGEDLVAGAITLLSPECRALAKFDDGPPARFVVPASCAEAAREANRREKADEQAKEKTFAAFPEVQYCLWLKYDTMPGKTMPEKTESAVNETLRRIQAMSDEEHSRLTDCALRVRWANSPIIHHCLGLKRTASQNPKDPFEGIDDDLRVHGEAMDRLRAMGADDWANVGACAKRVRAAGGLVAIDPVGEMRSAPSGTCGSGRLRLAQMGNTSGWSRCRDEASLSLGGVRVGLSELPPSSLQRAIPFTCFLAVLS